MNDKNKTVHQEELRQIDCEPRYPLGTRGELPDGTPCLYVKFGRPTIRGESTGDK